ncbi:MAG: helix-turn-helix domain-containing protein [Anaerolineaceae bacterium]|nr:helix-turn-helix domain-containing protein [Anaerolineaceae bacterium]
MNVPAAERTLQIIELILGNPEGITLQELLASLDISRSSLFLLLNTLKQQGYAEQSEQRGRYRPGPRLQAWRGSNRVSSQEIIPAFYQEAGRTACTETLALAAETHGGALILAQVESPQSVRAVLKTGLVAPMGQTAAGAVFSSPPPEEVRRRGYALRRDGDVIELALPVCRDGIHPDYALLFVAPAYRDPDQKVDDALALLREMAARLSYRLGAAAYAPFHENAENETPAATPLGKEEMEEFLKGPWPARLACVRPDGSPHVVPVWQEWDGQDFHILAWKGSRWADYILGKPSVSLSVDETWPPLRRVTARGSAAPVQEPVSSKRLRPLLNRLYRRYLGQSAPANAEEQIEWIFRITPLGLKGWKGLS